MNIPLVAAVWLLNTVLDTAGQLAFKAAAAEPARGSAGKNRWRSMFIRPWLWLGIGCFAAEFVVWLAFLSLVSLADGVLLGMAGIVTITIGGRLWFGEHLSRQRLAGIGLILLGVAIVGVA
jgi:drug/metabolite transporter (DMT)-like permease